MSKKYTLKERLRYYFDNTLSRGTVSLVMWLAILTVFLVLLFAAIYTLTGINNEGAEGMGFFDAFWESLMRSMDPGGIAADTGLAFRIVGFVITIGGIFILSTLIGVLTSGLDTRLEDLRKGRSKVIESNHTLILGWSSKIFHIIRELIIANENQKKARIVILADKDKVEMEDEIRDNLDNTKTTKIICRSGNPLDIIDLEIVNPHEAKSIIVLSPSDTESADTYVLKSVLAITHNPRRKKENYHIVAEIKEKANMEAAKLVGKGEAMYILTPDLSARITAQTCRQSGLSIVYTQLLCYEGDELYFKEEPTLSGKTFKDAVYAYNSSSVIGFLNKEGKVLINPPMDSVLTNDDKILAISEDDDTVILSGKTEFNVQDSAIVESNGEEINKPEKNLILGWNHRGQVIARELDKYVEEGSELHVITETKEAEEIVTILNQVVKKQKITAAVGNISELDVLLKNNVTDFNNIIILSYTEMNIHEADAKTLIALLHLRNIAQQTDKKINIVSEMCDIKNKELAEVTKADDFIISDNLISQMLTQLSESKDLKKVFDSLFDADGSEIYLKNITDYVQTDKEMNFYTLIEAATKKGQTAIGYRQVEYAHDVDKNYGIRVNPKKDDLVKFNSHDKLIVLAED